MPSKLAFNPSSKLVIGAGERRIEGAIHHDVQRLPGIDIICDFWELPKKVDRKFTEIHMTHVLEHFPMASTYDALKVVRSLLSKGGKLYIEVPNFQWQAAMILKNPLSRQIVEYAYGGQHNAWDYHYNGFTPDLLISDLMTAGFIVDDLKPSSSIECWAIRV